MIELEPAAREMTRLLDGVTDERLTDATPCEGIPVAGLLDHLVGLSLAFTWGARKSGAGAAPRASAESLDPEWRAVLPQRLAELVEAWRDPAAWEGMAEVGGIRMPSEVMGVVALDELVMHGWDLARATGQEFACDPASAEAILEFTRNAAESGGGRIFGPPVEVSPDATVFDRALGFAGRDPAWTPS